MPESAPRSSRRFHWLRGIGPSAGLLLLLAAVDLAALWGIVVARGNAVELARSDLELQTRLHAGAFESSLANLYADLALLGESPALGDWTQEDGPGPSHAVDLAASGLLERFLANHPPLRRLRLSAPAGDSPPLVLDREGERIRRLEGSVRDPIGAVVRGRILLRTGPGHLDAWLEPRMLLAALAPGIEGVELAPSPPAETLPPGLLVAATPIHDERWSPPLRRWVVRTEDPARRVGSIEDLLGRLRRILVANAVVILLTLVLGAAGLRHVRHTARVEAEADQEKRIRELENAALQAERLAGLGRMAAGIAHEINNPLEGMTNYQRLLREDLEQGDLDGASRMAAGLAEGIERIAGVTRTVLSYADPRTAPPERVELVALVDRTLAFLDGNRSLDHLRLSRAGAAEDVTIDGNPTTLSQLVLNLVLNAGDAQPREGEVEVEVVRDDEGRAVLEVRDRGPGIPAEVRSRLFEPFVSGRGSTGLGLALCRTIVEEHGGSIEALDRVGGGTVFRIHLPLVRDLHDPAAVQREDSRWDTEPRS